MSKFILATLFLVCIFATPIPPTAAAAATNWCYQFDFTTSNYGITPLVGEWMAGQGFVTDDETGQVLITYSYGQTVRPTSTQVTFTRRDGVEGFIDLRAPFDIFGIVGNYQGGIPDVLRNAWLNSTVVSGSVEGSSFTVHLIASRGAAISKLAVAGNGENVLPASNCQDVFSKEPTPTPIPIPANELYDGISEADDALSAVDVPLSAPDGAPLLPDPDVVLLFGYVKWITSPGAAQELFGPFDGIFTHLGILLVMQFSIFGVYLVVFFVSSVIRWVLWIYTWILKIAAGVAIAPVVIAVLAIAAAIIAIVAAVNHFLNGG
jgi:hypothetical protein